MAKWINYLATMLSRANTVDSYIRKAKARGIKRVDVGVSVLSIPDAYEINLDPSLTPTWPSSTVYMYWAEGTLLGKYSKLKKMGLEKAVEIAEKLKKENFDVVIEGKSVDEMRNILVGYK